MNKTVPQYYVVVKHLPKFCDGFYFWMPAHHCGNGETEDQLIGPYPTEEMCRRQARCSHDANLNTGGADGRKVSSK